MGQFFGISPHRRGHARDCVGVRLGLFTVMKKAVGGVVLLLLAGGTALAQAPVGAVYRVPSAIDDGWNTARADTLGVDSARLGAMTAAIRAWPELNVHAVVIERAGALIYEEYFDGPDERGGYSLGRVTMSSEVRHDVRSVTKSVVSALVGIAVGSGAIPTLDRPLVDWFPEYPDLNTPERRRVTLRHALSMTSGLQWNEETPVDNDDVVLMRDAQPLRYVLARPFAHPPGSVFTYNSGLTEVLGGVLERATNTPIEEYARTRLFGPLGISDVEWWGNIAGMPRAAGGLRLRARDMAKFGSLYLHGGRWNGSQIVPADWVDQSTRRHVQFEPRDSTDAGGAFGYAYLWWYNCYPTDAGLVEARTAVGLGQQRIFVLPGLDMVVTILAGRYNDFAGATLATRILREHVLPAVKTDTHFGCSGS